MNHSFPAACMGFFVLLLGCSWLALSLGPAELALTDWLAGRTDQLGETIFHDIRLPRLLLVICNGAAVAMAGAAIQGVFRNPLADPALIGVSSGAALFAAGFMVLGIQGTWIGVVGVSGSAFLGGLLTTLLVVLIGRQSQTVSGILLAGIAINAVALAGVGLFSFLTDEAGLRSVTFWALGSFSGAKWQDVYTGLLLLPLLGALQIHARRLDVATLGDVEARHLGVDIQQLRQRIIWISALLVGISVSLAGIISFIGLVVPHLVRLLGFSTHRYLLPLSALLGAVLLTLADTACRLVLAPNELPVGIVTALVGGPFFMYLVYHQRSRLGL